MATDASPAYRAPDFHHPEIPEISVCKYDGLKFWQHMLSGSVAGSVEHMAMFPVDTLKTRMQVLVGSGAGSSGHPATHVGVRQAFRSILKVEGPAGLYRGIAAMGLGAAPAHAAYFSILEVCDRVFSREIPNSHVAHAAAGAVATIAQDAVFTPMDVVKQRLQLKSSPYKGVADCVRRVLMEEGVGAFYKSYKTTVLMNAPFYATHFATYEAAKRALGQVAPDTADEESLVVHATAGATAGGLAAAVTTPLDVVKTRLQCQGVCGCDRFSSGSIRNVIKTIVKKEGYHGLMRGWIPRMLFHAPASAICWSTYEAAKSYFQQLNDDQDNNQRSLSLS